MWYHWFDWLTHRLFVIQHIIENVHIHLRGLLYFRTSFGLLVSYTVCWFPVHMIGARRCASSEESWVVVLICDEQVWNELGVSRQQLPKLWDGRLCKLTNHTHNRKRKHEVPPFLFWCSHWPHDALWIQVSGWCVERQIQNKQRMWIYEICPPHLGQCAFHAIFGCGVPIVHEHDVHVLKMLDASHFIVANERRFFRNGSVWIILV